MSGHLPDVLRPITVPASWLYRIAIARRNARYDRARDVRRVNCPVISVGNLTTGGTGKTPTVAWIARTLNANGAHPAIALRGYGARPGEESDEALEYADRLPGVPVIVNPDRAAGIEQALSDHLDIDCVVLDDGFQHRRLARDLDLVLIDASRDTHRDELLPAGTLREPPDSLRRADAVILTHADSIPPALEAWIERHHGRPPLARTRHVWRGLERHDASGTNPLPLSWLEGRRVITLFGVGHPDAIVAQVEAAGADVIINVRARDHERYDAPRVVSLAMLCDQADAVLTTRKDWVKLGRLIDFSSFPVPVVTPDLGIEFIEGEDALRSRLIETVRERPRDADR